MLWPHDLPFSVSVPLLIDGVGLALFPKSHDSLAFVVLILSIDSALQWYIRRKEAKNPPLRTREAA